MRVLILGADGMLGHRLRGELANRHEVGATVRSAEVTSGSGRIFDAVDVRCFEQVERALDTFRPEAVVNATGLVKQRPEGRDPLAALEVNAVFPQRLARLCGEKGVRVVQFSTDCVFSGGRGGYRETDPPDPSDLYGRTKLLGEVGHPHLTLRTSMIGLERGRRQGLLEWFLASRGTVKGYRRAIFSGLTTIEIGRVVSRILERHPEISGVYHLAGRPTDKYALLVAFKELLGRTDVEVEPADEPVIDRSLNGESFAAATGYEAPPWDELLAEQADAVGRRKKS